MACFLLSVTPGEQYVLFADIFTGWTSSVAI
jgi:hypothetical protein